MRKLNIRDETRTFLLLALAIFLTEFFIMITLEIVPSSLHLPYARIILDASILVLIISPLLILPKKKVTDTKNRLKRILEEAGDGLLVIDRNYNLIMANSAVKEITGNQTQDLIGKKCFEILPNEFCSTQKCYMKRILSGEKTVVDEKFQNGYWIQDVTTPYRDADGNIQGIIKAFRDVTDHRKKGDRIERLNNILKAIRNINELIIREPDVEKMLSDSCSILREVREYFHVAIAACGHRVEKVAESGQGGYFEVGEEVPLCVKKVIESEEVEKKPIILDDTKEHCGKCPYHKEGQRYSAALIPFNTKEGLKLLAVFADINHFDEEEIELLKGIADDIGFAVDKHTAEKERKITEKEKEEQQKLLQAIINSTPDFVVFKDINLVYKMANKSFCQFVGKSHEEIVGKTDYDIFPPDEAEMFCRDDSYLMEKGQTQVQDEEVTGAKGKSWLQVAKTPVYNPSGNVIGLLCSVRDVTERKKYEEALRESEGKLNAMLQSIGDHMSMMDKDLNIIWANDVAKQNFGEDLVGKKCYEVYHKRDKPCEPSPCLTLRAFEDGETHEHETSIINKHGEKRYFHCSANVALRDEEDNPIGVIEISRDVTDRKTFEQALQESEQKYRTTFEHTGTAMMVLEEGSTISLVNEEFERLTGYTKEEVENKMDWKDLIHPDDLNLMRNYCSSQLKNEVTTRYEFRIVDKSGDERNVVLAIGNIPGLQKSVASLMDITNLRKLNKLLNASSEINELVAKEKNPEVVLKCVCEKLSLLYNFVFTSLRKNGKLVPVESVGIDFDSMNRVIRNCPSVAKAMNGHIMKMKVENSLCKQCTAEPHKYALSIPLIHDKNWGVITVHSNSDFSQDEIKLLEKLSSNIAFALSAYEVANDRKAAMEQLTQNLAQFDKSADRLRNPLAVILNSLELVEEIGSDNVLEIIKKHSMRIKKELDEMREEEMKTYELTTESIKEI